jgi:hypothetical protein
LALLDADTRHWAASTLERLVRRVESSDFEMAGEPLKIPTD